MIASWTCKGRCHAKRKDAQGQFHYLFTDMAELAGHATIIDKRRQKCLLAHAFECDPKDEEEWCRLMDHDND